MIGFSCNSSFNKYSIIKKMQLSILFFIANFLYIASASLIGPNKPSEDSFYTPPKGYENSKPGDILQFRKAPAKLASSFFPIDVKNVWQVLVRSEDSFGNPNAIVTTIMEPYSADPMKVVSYQTYEDSANIDCSPSYGFLFGANPGTVATQTDMPFIVMALKNGYYVVSPDYEGPKSTFTAGRQSGQAVLNSIRATLNSTDITGIDKNAKVAMWGYSGGSLASSFAAALQPVYAPDLSEHLIGVALGGFVTNITATAEITDGTPFAGLIPNALMGLANEYPDFEKNLFAQVSNPIARLALKNGREYCMIPAMVHYLGRQFFGGLLPVFPKGFGILNNDVINKVIYGNSMVTLANEMMPQIPTFIYHGSLDRIVPIVGAKSVYQQWCNNNIASLEFAEDTTGGHISETIVGAPAAWTWLEQRFEGKQPVKGCSHDTRASNFLYPGIKPTTLQFFQSLYETFLGSPLGPFDDSKF
ncbi:uncharacterized protein J8A68_004743 [[Candida] subhashii]|uniref:Triacylglycerol lipase n=1 Tax=[Candida] subhashii TaxID=561895 RepID=A0A8J5UK78_9ASCO|nr:uncharacterized protein J8A68_004743 [[Candida] subhashii]KAG7661741.1 hypothetical protein J8A68_004743 [[Candida] subhashii]